MPIKIEGSLLKILNIKRLMSIPSPLKQYHFHAILIWLHSPFKIILEENENMSALQGKSTDPFENDCWTAKLTPLCLAISQTLSRTCFLCLTLQYADPTWALLLTYFFYTQTNA